MIKIEKLTPYQREVYPLLLRTIAELVDEGKKTTYHEIQKQAKQTQNKTTTSIQGIDIQLALLTLVNEAILNVTDGTYHFNALREENILELAKLER